MEDRFFDKADQTQVSVNHYETTQIAVSGFLKHSEETGPIPDCSFYLAVSTYRDATVFCVRVFFFFVWGFGFEILPNRRCTR